MSLVLEGQRIVDEVWSSVEHIHVVGLAEAQTFPSCSQHMMRFGEVIARAAIGHFRKARSRYEQMVHAFLFR